MKKRKIVPLDLGRVTPLSSPEGYGGDLSQASGTDVRVHSIAMQSIGRVMRNKMRAQA